MTHRTCPATFLIIATMSGWLHSGEPLRPPEQSWFPQAPALPEPSGEVLREMLKERYKSGDISKKTHTYLMEDIQKAEKERVGGVYGSSLL